MQILEKKTSNPIDDNLSQKISKGSDKELVHYKMIRPRQIGLKADAKKVLKKKQEDENSVNFKNRNQSSSVLFERTSDAKFNN